jgi:hypothetical protein
MIVGRLINFKIEYTGWTSPPMAPAIRHQPHAAESWLRSRYISCDLGWTKWHCKYFGSSMSVSFHQCSTITFHLFTTTLCYLNNWHHRWTKYFSLFLPSINDLHSKGRIIFNRQSLRIWPNVFLLYRPVGCSGNTSEFYWGGAGTLAVVKDFVTLRGPARYILGHCLK